MIKNKLRFKRIVTAICLLVTVGILCIQNSMTAHAAAEGGYLPGRAAVSTMINSPGALDAEGISTSDTKPNGWSITYSEGNGELNGTLRILLILTLISVAPALIIMMTSFTRIIIVLHFTRTALNTQTAPPNQVLIGLALILTFFIMEPTITQINEQAVKPYQAGEISQDEALEKAIVPLREFMYPQTQVKDVQMFMNIAGKTWSGENDDIPLSVLLPSFMLSELRIAFWIGFMIYIPFIVIDMVVASTLMSMGMMMLPPTTISMPFKILLFVLADGWSLIIDNLVRTFFLR